MSLKEYDLRRPLGELMALAEKKFGKVDFEPVTVGDDTLQFLQVQDMPAYIEKLVAQAPAGKPVELPLWAKIWPTAVMLSMMARQLPPGASLLEVGAGVGVCGLFAAKRGLKVLITDIEPDALLFARINILKNGLEENADVATADFTGNGLGRNFDFVFGCEVVYEPKHYKALADFLLGHLAEGPGREIVLAMETRGTTHRFFEEIKDRVKIMRREFPLPSDEGEAPKATTLYRMIRA